MDRIDRMLEELREALPEITWDRDAVSEDAPEGDFGCVELTGSHAFYSEDRLVAIAVRMDIWVSLRSSGAGLLDTMKTVLNRWSDEGAFAWGFPERRYLYDQDAVVWRWHCEADWGPEDADTDGDAEETGD